MWAAVAVLVALSCFCCLVVAMGVFSVLLFEVVGVWLIVCVL